MPTTAPLSKEQALYLRLLQRNQETARVLRAHWRSTEETPLSDAMFYGSMAAEENVRQYFYDLRDWGGLLLAGPDSTAFALAQKMQPLLGQGGEA